MANIALAPVLDLSNAAGLKQALLDAFLTGEDVFMDAGEVQRISSPCFQLLVAAVGRGAGLSNVSPALTEAAITLGLLAALKLEAPDV